jgi:Mrp family chromosome partitioning ATPase
MSKNFELLQRVERGDFFNLPVEPAPLPQKAPPAIPLKKTPPDPEIAKLVQRLFSQTSKGSGPKVVSFSGITRGDRSSWICARAGEALAEHVDTSVCIVDANLLSPQLHDHVKAGNQIGLADALTNKDSIRSFATQLCSGNLWLISAGLMKPNLYSPAERCRARFDELRQEFNYILISAPPFTRITEAILMGQLADGIVLIVEANQTRRESVRQVKKSLETAQVQLLGSVLDQRTFPIPEFLYRKL